jgi:hypothetical protein
MQSLTTTTKSFFTLFITFFIFIKCRYTPLKRTGGNQQIAPCRLSFSRAAEAPYPDDDADEKAGFQLITTEFPILSAGHRRNFPGDFAE